MRTKPRFLRSLLGRYIRWRSGRRKRDDSYVHADLQPAATDDFLRDHGYATLHSRPYAPGCHARPHR